MSINISSLPPEIIDLIYKQTIKPEIICNNYYDKIQIQIRDVNISSDYITIPILRNMYMQSCSDDKQDIRGKIDEIIELIDIKKGFIIRTEYDRSSDNASFEFVGDDEDYELLYESGGLSGFIHNKETIKEFIKIIYDNYMEARIQAE